MKIIKSHKNAFTLIELIVVMTIMTILTMASYTPFSYYKTKQKVKNSTKIITQTLYNARSNSIYGILHINPTLTGNLDIGVLFEERSNKIKILGFPFSEINPPIDYKTDNKYLLREIKLEPGVEITSSGGLFLYKAITGSGIYKDFTIVSNKIELSVGFKGIRTGGLTRKIEYYTKTYISDVKK